MGIFQWDLKFLQQRVAGLIPLSFLQQQIDTGNGTTGRQDRDTVGIEGFEKSAGYPVPVTVMGSLE